MVNKFFIWYNVWHPFCFLAHLSRRLNGKLIVLVGIRRTLSIIHQHFKTSLASEATGPIKAKFYVEPLWVGEMKVPSIGHGYITKMAAMLYMVITLKNLHSN